MVTPSIGAVGTAIAGMVLFGEAKEADLYWMSDVWNRYLAEIATRRKIDVAKLNADIDGMAAGIEAVVFDRGGYTYGGRIAALADAAREGGLKF